MQRSSEVQEFRRHNSYSLAFGIRVAHPEIEERPVSILQLL